VAIAFHLDEQIPPALADALRSRGIDVTTTADAGLTGTGDREHLVFAATSGRVVITQDRTPDCATESRTIAESSRSISKPLYAWPDKPGCGGRESGSRRCEQQVEGCYTVNGADRR
jgi:hypothetical protein